MKPALVVAALLVITPVFADAPTETSVVELLSLTHSEANMEKMYGNN
jgi:hypothetical protein